MHVAKKDDDDNGLRAEYVNKMLCVHHVQILILKIRDKKDWEENLLPFYP